MTELQKNQLHEIKTTLEYAVNSIKLNSDKPEETYFLILNHLAGLIDGTAFRIRAEIKRIETKPPCRSVTFCHLCKEKESSLITSQGRICLDCFDNSDIAKILEKAITEKFGEQNAKT